MPDVKAGNVADARRVLKELKVDGVTLPDSERSEGDGVPGVVGMGAKDAVYLLERKGLRVRLQGTGRVRSQSIAQGQPVRKGQTVVLKLN